MSTLSSSPESLRHRLEAHLRFLYPDADVDALRARLEVLLARRRLGAPRPRPSLREHLKPGDAFLITYADQVREQGRAPLATLAEVLETRLAGIVTGVHLLPFYPWTSDDGFSVADFRAVDPDVGAWEDVERLGGDFRLMVDLVLNHVSSQSAWFRGYLAGEARYAEYFIAPGEDFDASQVVRPRALPLLTPVETAAGPREVWTTFSADQMDLNYASPDVLLEMLDVLLGYVEHGARVIRLDAVAFLWKRSGTRSVHLLETHRVVQLMRDVLDAAEPEVMLLTETNVPHADNVSYFGDGTNEAQMVYQFPLAPLVLHALATGDATQLAGWLRELEAPGEGATFFNFLASHDGIGVLPAQGILSPVAIQSLAERTLAHGGRVSTRSLPGGGEAPYELNITLFDALSDPGGDESTETKIDRFMVAEAIMLVLAGVPGIYVHSLFGSPSDHAGFGATGRARSLNRHKWSRDELEAMLADPEGVAARVLARHAALLEARAATPALHPLARQEIVASPPALLVIRRGEPEEALIGIHNVSGALETLRLSLPPGRGEQAGWRDAVSGRKVCRSGERELVLELRPYEVVWLRREREP